MVLYHPKPCVFFTKLSMGETSCAAKPSGKDACERLHLSLKVHSLSISAKCEQHFWERLEGKLIFLPVLFTMQPSRVAAVPSAFLLLLFPALSPAFWLFPPAPLPPEFWFLPYPPSSLLLSWRDPPPPPPFLACKDLMRQELEETSNLKTERKGIY